MKISEQVENEECAEIMTEEPLASKRAREETKRERESERLE